jgi:hypothetical protein
MNAREKILSTGDRWPREMRIISKMWVDGLLLLRPQIYGERHIGAALEKIIVMATVRACETDGALCTEAQIAKPHGEAGWKHLCRIPGELRNTHRSGAPSGAGQDGDRRRAGAGASTLEEAA